MRKIFLILMTILFSYIMFACTTEDKTIISEPVHETIEPTPTPNEPTPTPNEPTPTPNEPTSTPNEPTPTPIEPTPSEPTEDPQQGYPTDEDGLILLTREQLSHYDGRDGRNAYIAVNGYIYDVTNSARWRDGNHNGYRAGADLTQEIMTFSPHGLRVLDNIPIIGRLID